MPTLAYRVRVRNEANNADLVTWTMADIATAPSGDGTQIDVSTGQTRSGSYTVSLADRFNTAPDRTVTKWLADSAGRNRLLSRRAFVERQLDGGGFTVMISGYITRVSMRDAATVDVQIGESLRVPATARAFTAATASSVRAAILGGPLTGDWGPLRASVGWTMTVATVGGSLYARLVTLVPTVGAVPPTFAVGQVTRAMQDQVNALALDAVAARGAPFAEQVFTNQSQFAWRVAALSTALTPIGGGAVITATPVVVFPFSTLFENQPALLRFGENGTAVGFSVDWPAGALPTVGDAFTVRVSYIDPSPSCPVYYDTHPLTIASELYTAAGVDIDAASFASCLLDVGAQLRLAVRITDATPLQSWIEGTIAGPLGVTFLPDSQGRIAARLVRRTLSALPSPVLALDDINAVGQVWELEEGSAVARIAWTQLQFVQGADPKSVDGMLAQTQTDTRTIGDQTTYASRVLTYSVDGMYHSAGTFSAVNQLAATGGLLALAGRYSRGAATAEYTGIRSRAVVDALTVGDYIQVSIPSLPVGNVRIGDVGGTPARVMQVMRITERPATREVLLEDAGPTNNPFTTVPTLSISTATAGGQVTALVTVTNAAALNTAVASLAMQVAYTAGASPAATDWDYIFAVSAPESVIPTTAIGFPLALRDTTVWFRARATSGSEIPSAFSTAVSAVVATVAGLTGFAAAAISGNGAALALSWTRATTDGAVFDIEARTGSNAFTPRLTLPQTSINATLGDLLPSTSYDTRGRARIESTGQISAWSTSTVTTNGTALTIADPTSVRAGSSGAGTYVVFGVVAGTPVPRMEAEAALETAVGSGSYGSYVPFGSGEPDASGACSVLTAAPNDGLRRRVRVRASNAYGVSAYVVASPDVTPWTSQPVTGGSATASFTTLRLFRDATPFPVSVEFTTAGAPTGAVYRVDWVQSGVAGSLNNAANTSVLIATGSSTPAALVGQISMYTSGGAFVTSRNLPTVINT